MEKTTHEGLPTLQTRVGHTKKNSRKVHKEEDDHLDPKEELRRRLRNDELIIDIKTKLKETQFLLRKSKLNGTHLMSS